jgi:TRAP transporter TAXI family solute receptor
MSNGHAVKVATTWVTAALLGSLAVAPSATSARAEAAADARTGEPGSASQLQRATARSAKPLTLVKQVNPANRYTVGFVTGPPTGTDATIAHEISTVLAAGQETGPNGEMALRVLGMVGRGGIQNVRDVLTLPGADLSMVPVVLLNRLRDRKELGDIDKKLAYLAPLFTEEFHVVARREIRSAADLAGKTVNLGEEGSNTDILAREILASLDLKVEDINVDQKQAFERMRAGEVAATMIVAGRPSSILSDAVRDAGFHLVPIPFTSTLDGDYLPATLTHEDYPNLIGQNERVNTLAVGSVLVAYDWRRGTERYQLLQTFVESFFSRISEFHAAARHPKWKEVNLAADLPGWRRFGPAERWLKRSQPAGEVALRNEFERFLDQTGSVDPARTDRERLFQDFLRWRQQR